MFYELNTFDLFGSNPWKRDEIEHQNSTFGAYMNLLSRATDFLDEGARYRNDHLIEDEARIFQNGSLSIQANGEVANWLPDG